MSKIHIVNWLLTRRCNLDCDYCAIVKNYEGKPAKYPDMNHYIRNEMTLDYIKYSLSLFKEHNPNAFHILYGGEPLLRKDLPEIVNFCNDNDIYYTIISNNTKQIQGMIQKLFEETEYIQGFTSSVDPIFNSGEPIGHDRVIKSIEGFKQLVEIKKQGRIKDVVAEITVMKHNVHHLYNLVKSLSLAGINSDITFIDIAKNPYYDFSNISDENLLVTREEADEQLKMLLSSNFDIHMKDKLIPEIYNALPSNMDCKINEKLHNVTIDADGSVRLCLRIRGILAPTQLRVKNLFSKDDIKRVSPFAHMCITKDKEEYCKLCNHTCQLMSQIIDSEELEVDSLIHQDKREGK